MEALILLLLIVLLIIVVTGNGGQRAQLQNLQQQIADLRTQLQQALKSSKRPEDVFVPDRPRALEEPMPDIQRWAPKQDEVFDEPIPEPQPAPGFPSIQIPEQEREVVLPQPEPVPVRPPLPPPPLAPPPPRPGFFERNPDLEKFIGENLISKIGIAILVIGIGFFVKYAIDRDWIGPAGRVGIGVLCGGILVGLAHRLQRSYKAFSSVLVGGGLAVLYFSIALAYKDYALFSQTAAFIIMVVITLFAILLSLLYDRQEVAIIALAGGFAVPFLVSDGSGNYVTLFTYLLLLNGGLLVIAYRKEWRLLNGIAFAATALIYWGWLATLSPATPPRTFFGGLAFATAFYLLFLAINLAHNIRERKRFIASDFGILLTNTGLFFSAGIYLLYAAGAAGYKGLFTASLGVLNFALTAVLVRRRNIDTTILYLLVGVTLTFVSLTAPLQLRGHSITLFWAAESVVLLWLFQQSRIRVLQWGLLAVWLCTFFSLLMDWTQVYGGTATLPPLVNRGFMTTLVAAAANAALYRLMLRPNTDAPFPVFERTGLTRFFGAAALVLLFAAGAFETGYQAGQRYPSVGLSPLYLLLYTTAFVLGLGMLARRGVIRLHWAAVLALMGACLAFYLLSIPHVAFVQNIMLLTAAHNRHFIAHWISAVLVAILLYRIIQTLPRQERAQAFYPAATWAAATFAVILISVEGGLLTKALAQATPQTLTEIQQDYTRIGLPILWGLCSFALMWLGMRHKYRPLRIASLTLFSITLLKLFLFDIQDAGAGGKIAAFCSLGVLLLVVSFMYQRLKRIIIEDEHKEDAV